MSLHSGLSSTHGLRVLRAICLVECALVTLSPAYGQSTAEWLTSSADPNTELLNSVIQGSGFSPDQPTPTRPSSWGKLKILYR